MQRSVIGSQTVTPEFEGADRKISSAQASEPAQGAPAASEEERGPSLTVEPKDLP